MLGVGVRRTAICTLLAALALSPAAADAAGWLSPARLNLAFQADLPSVAMDGGGNIVAAWETLPVGSTPTAIQGAHRLIGPSGFVPLSNFSDDAANDNGSPLIVTNASGDGLVVWAHTMPPMATQEIELRTIGPGGAVGAPQRFGTGGGSFADPAAAIDAAGDAVVAWQHGGVIEAITRAGLGGAFSLVVPLDGAGTGAPSVAIDGAGNAVAVWQATNGGGGIGVATHAAGAATWTISIPRVPDTGGHTFTSPAISANPSGNAVLAFMDSSDSTVAATIGSVSVPGSMPVTLSGSGVNHGPDVTVDDAGDAAVGWSTGDTAQISLKPARGGFPVPANVQTISTPGVDSFALGGNGAGDVIASWSLFDNALANPVDVVQAAVKPRGASTFGSLRTISNTATFSAKPVVALDQAGDAVAAIDLQPTQTDVAAAIYDNTAPTVGTPTGPATTKPNTSATFSVAQPTDRFSSASLSWSFGDGAAAGNVTSVSHTFKRTGSFTVMVTATDTARNTSSATRRIKVANPPPCKVPKLKGKTLSQAKKLLSRANCKLGKVQKPKPRKHQKLRKLVVGGSSPGAGRIRPLGTKVALTLVQVPKPKPKPKHKTHK